MGIRGLAGYLKWKTPHLRRELQWDKHYGESWGIDCSCILYRASAAGLTPLSVLAKLLVQMKKYSITPIVIFDGRPPSTKDTIIEQRRVQRVAAQDKIKILESEMGTPHMSKIQRAFLKKRMSGLRSQTPQISAKEKNDIKQFLYGAGILFLTAIGEADDVLAYLSREQTIQAVVSTDMDMFPRGVKTLIIPDTNDASILGEIHTSSILDALNLTYSQFVDACVMMGSDYMDKSWQTIQPELAIEIALQCSSWNNRCFDPKVISQLNRGASMLRGDNQSWDTIFSDSQQYKWMMGTPQPEPDTLKEMCQKNGWPEEWSVILSSPISLIA
jgi:hypothetical protein